MNKTLVVKTTTALFLRIKKGLPLKGGSPFGQLIPP
jgi:hypothetical protein